MWYIIGFFDNIIKLFQYAWFIIVPVITILIFLLIKKKNMDKSNIKKIKIISIIIKILILSVIVCLFTIRAWGPNLYKVVISFSICNKEKYIEKKLEDKYGKNFNYVSQDKIVIEEYSDNALGQDINGDYSVRYYFKDDDGVFAIVNYKKNYQSDYYESKRSKYEIEKKVYDYAKEIGFNKKFYVYVESFSELINDSNLNDKVKSNYILDEKYHDRIIFILTEKSDENKVFIVTILKRILGNNNNFYVHEHVVTDSEYERAVKFYNSVSSKNGIAGSDYEEYFDFKKENQKEFKYYFINK